MNKAMPIDYPSAIPAIIPGAGSNDDALLDIKSILAAVRRRMWLILLSFLVTFMLVAAVTFQRTPIYTATTRVIVDTRETNVVDFSTVLSGLAPNTAIIDTEVEVIKSSALLEKVVNKLDLTQDAEFNYDLAEPTTLQIWRGRVSNFVSGLLPSSDGPVEQQRALTEEEQAAELMNDVVGVLRNKVAVDRLGPTYIIDISVFSERPQMAADLANAIADQYRVEQLEAKLEATRRANLWLNERLGDLKEEVNAKESEVEEFRSASGLLSAQGSTLTEQQIADLTAQRIQREANLAEAEARLNNVRSQVNAGVEVDAIAEVLGSPVIGELRSQLAQVRRNKADLQTRYGPRHPDVLRVLSEENDLNQQIRAEVNRIISNLEGEVAIARQQVAALNRSVAGARSRLSSNNRSLVRLRELEREAEASRTLYEEFLARFKETNEQDDLAQADARVLSGAVAPDRPSSPKPTLNLILAFLMGTVVAGALALLAELLDNHISTGDDVERMFRVPSIGAIPLLPNLNVFGKPKLSPADYLVENPLSAFAESIRNLRASIIFADLDSESKTVAISSSLPDEGKTSLVFCLGRMSAMSGARTLIIDGDFRRRQLTEAVGIEPKTGFIEHLFGEVSLQDAIYVDEKTGVEVLPLTDARNTPRDVFGSRAFDRLLIQLKEAYDLIVIDTGPVLLMAESRVVASKVDQVIVAARWRSTGRQSLQQTLNILKEFNANIAGVVMTFVDLRRRRHHNYGGANYKAYSKYYTYG
ncbi:MAG: Wzz/FepE/Etk N-terminal domain-containing protein [Pseudomonadota bacterium]